MDTLVDTLRGVLPRHDSRAIREYFDLLPILEVQRKAYRERLRHGQT